MSSETYMRLLAAWASNPTTSGASQAAQRAFESIEYLQTMMSRRSKIMHVKLGTPTETMRNPVMITSSEMGEERVYSGNWHDLVPSPDRSRIPTQISAGDTAIIEVRGKPRTLDFEILGWWISAKDLQEQNG